MDVGQITEWGYASATVHGDNLAIMREYIPDESVDLDYLGPR